MNTGACEAGEKNVIIGHNFPPRIARDAYPCIEFRISLKSRFDYTVKPDETIHVQTQVKIAQAITTHHVSIRDNYVPNCLVNPECFNMSVIQPGSIGRIWLAVKNNFNVNVNIKTGQLCSTLYIVPYNIIN